MINKIKKLIERENKGFYIPYSNYLKQQKKLTTSFKMGLK